MKNKEVMELPDFIKKYKITNAVMHKCSGMSYQYLNKVITGKAVGKVMISCNIKTGAFRVHHPDIAAGKLDTDLFKQGEE